MRSKGAHKTAGGPPIDYADALAARIQESQGELSARWLVGLKTILPVDANAVFPGDSLLDHIPTLLHELGGYLHAPESEEIAANTSVVSKAAELGLMRHRQRASVHQILREYELLGRVLGEFVAAETERLGLEPTPQKCIAVIGRLNHAVQILMQTTVDTFVAEYTHTIQHQTERLRSFNRTVGHELRNPLNTLQLAIVLLRSEAQAAGDGRWLDVMQRNLDQMARLLGAIEQLSRAEAAADTPSEQSIEVAAIAGEVMRQLGEMAAARGVVMSVEPGLPVVHVDAARLELVLLNLVSNAIKYADPEKPSRWVRIAPCGASASPTCALEVRDNGIGIGAEALPRIFERFFRAHTEHDERLGNDGSGLGLAIAAECVQAIGGTIAVESSPGVGTCFKLSLPARNGSA